MLAAMLIEAFINAVSGQWAPNVVVMQAFTHENVQSF